MMPKTIDEFVEARIKEAVDAERKKIFDGLIAVDRAADSHFNFAMATKAYIAGEFKQELRALKNDGGVQ